MFFVKVLDLSKVPILVLWIVIEYVLNVKGYVRKKSMYNLISLSLSLTLIFLHVAFNKMPNVTLSSFNIIIDFAFLIISISLYLYINDIETRRKVISEVFENRYKKREKINESSSSKSFKFKSKNR